MNAPHPKKMTFTLAEDCEAGKAGQVITMAVSPADTSNQQEELDNYLGGFSNFGHCADKASPIVLVNKEKGKRRDFSKENVFEVVDTRVGRSGAINEIDHKTELGDYDTEEHALAVFLPWQSENDAEAHYNVRAASGDLIMEKVLLKREVDVWDTLTTLTSFDAANRTTLTSTLQWDTGATKNPRRDLHNRIKASATKVTDIFMNPDVGFWMLSDTEVRAYMVQMLGDNAPNPNVARAADEQGEVTFTIPGLPPITIVPAKKLDASGNLVYILGDDVVLTSSPPPPRDGNRIATSYSYRTRGPSGTGVTTNEYIPMERGLNKGTMFEAGLREDRARITSDIAGGLIKDVLSTV